MPTQSDQHRKTHQELRRVLNAHRRSQIGEAERLLALVCECGDAVCHRTVLMEPEEYDVQGDRPILHPSHGS